MRDDLEFLRGHPWERKETSVAGLVYDTELGVWSACGVENTYEVA
jgi:hypothetical protein